MTTRLDQGVCSRNMPNCIVIGAPRSGSTTLYEGLRRHPDVFMSPNKEPGFFRHYLDTEHNTGPGDDAPIRVGVTDLREYQSLFSGVASERIVGEASVVYLGSETAADAIQSCVPDARLIAVLRNPADRAYSQFSQHVQQGREPLNSFDAAIAAEPERLAAGWSPFWGYVELGFYARHLKRYRARFPEAQIGVFLYDDLKEDLPGFMRQVFAFLEIDQEFDPRLAEHINASGNPRSRFLHRFLTGNNAVKEALKPLVPYRARVVTRNIRTNIANRNLVSAPAMSNEVRRELLDRFRDDIHELEQMIDRDLSGWFADRGSQ